MLKTVIASSVVLHQYRKQPVFCQWQQKGNNISALDSPKCYDLVVVGGGIVGVATARELIQRHPKWKVAIVEKENELAVHQTGHNSGVIHAGIYYKPGSLKSKLCVEGMKLMYAYLDEKKIPYKKCGKLIVATDESEVEQLNELHRRGIENKVPDLKVIDADKITEIEPYCSGVKALWSPHTGIVDYKNVTANFARDFTYAGGEIHLGFEVNDFRENSAESNEHPIVIRAANTGNLATNDEIHTKYVLTCGGLHSDKLAELTGCSPAPRIIPFRGEYLLLSEEKAKLIRGNVYPVPDPKFPFLGVHFTPRMDGSVWVGPNAVLAFKREGYKWSQFSVGELYECLRFSGFLRLAGKYWKYGLQEMFRSSMVSLQIGHIQRYYANINVEDLRPGPAGVRAQAVGEDGNLVDDFVFDYGKDDGGIAQRVLHCRNAPSPGATSSLAIAKMISDKVDREFKI